MRKLHLIHRGVSATEFPPQYRPSGAWLRKWQRQFPALENCFVITLPARITRLKGHKDFINIVKRARLKGLPVHGLIVGGIDRPGSSYQRELLSLVRSGRLEKNITFLGRRDDIRDIMAISDVVMSLSQTPEAFGRTVLEALAIGTPVIAYRHGGVAEILADMFPRGAVEPFNIEACVKKLQEFYNITPVVTEENRFTLEAMQENTVRLYESCAKKA